MFLHAINTYADTMNQKFLDNNDFEVQVCAYVKILWFPSAYSLLKFSFSEGVCGAV